MNYTVSRNGQTYGPYTMDDLRRYLASGNVLPTDLARNESTPDWVPVAELLNSAPPPPPPQTFPTPADRGAGSFAAPSPLQPPGGVPSYAPTQGYPQGLQPSFNPSAYPDAPDLHWGLLLVLTLVTNGLFLLIWDLIVCNWLKKIQPGSKAFTQYIISYGLIVVFLVLAIAGALGLSLFSSRGAGAISAAAVLYALLLSACWIGMLVMAIVARFTERRELLEHFNGPEPVGLRLSGPMTFFFAGLYFQYHLNRIKQIKDAMRFGQSRPY